MSFSEDEFIRWVTEPVLTAAGGGLPAVPALQVGPGDDAAVLADGTILCVDTVVEGVHFTKNAPPQSIARKALGACLSDVCAMGAVAEAVLVSVQLAPGWDARALASGLRLWAQRFGVAMAGGDTVGAGVGGLAVSVTATGRLPEGADPWLRSGAQPGDLLVVSGPLGGSRSGRHLDVSPRADLVSVLRLSDTPVHAAMDLSDGLAVDLPRLLAASGVGAVIHGATVPIHSDVPAGGERLNAALADGEDFELLLSLDGGCTAPAGTTIIGRITESGLTLRDAQGCELPWPSRGFTHVF
ncbi:MAG: thiamine-monophosphate kinase [Pseudohongiellaceae bacterium]|jgi:thiamine-monophosphate kinase